MQPLLPGLEQGAVVVADDVVQRGQLLGPGHVGQVEEALPALGVLRALLGRQHPGELHGDQAGVQQDVLGAAGVDAAAVNRHRRGGGVEVFIVDAAHRAAVHGVGEVRAEALHVEPIRAPADLLVRGEADADLPVLQFGMGEEDLAGGHDLGHARLVVRAQGGVAVGDDQALALRPGHLREHRRVQHEAVFKGHRAAVVVLDDGGLHRRAGHAVHHVHVGDQPDGGQALRVGRDAAVDVAVLVHPGVRNAQGLHLLRQRLRQHQLLFRAGAGGAVLVRGGVVLHIVQEAFVGAHRENTSVQ